jgi:hypothetical protein
LDEDTQGIAIENEDRHPLVMSMEEKSCIARKLSIARWIWAAWMKQDIKIKWKLEENTWWGVLQAEKKIIPIKIKKVIPPLILTQSVDMTEAKYAIERKLQWPEQMPSLLQVGHCFVVLYSEQKIRNSTRRELSREFLTTKFHALSSRTRKKSNAKKLTSLNSTASSASLISENGRTKRTEVRLSLRR